MPKSTNYEIKTTLAIDGEKKFKEAMEDAQRSMRVWDAELKKIQAEFKATGDRERYLTERSEIFSEKVKQQEAIVEALNRAVKESVEKYGEAAAQTDGYRIKLSNATAKLYEMKTAAETTQIQLDTLGQTQIDRRFKEAIDEANRSMKLYQSEAKLLGVTYRNNGQDADYLAKRSQNLKEQIAAAEKIYVETAEAMQRSAKATGEMSEETVNLKIRTNEARIELTNLRRESEQVNRDLEELGRDSQKIGRQIERGIGDAAEDTADKLDDMFEKIEKDVAALKSNTAISGFVDIAGFIKGAATSIDDFAASSREYRRSMSFLEQNAQTYNLEFKAVKELFFEMASVTGEVDSSVEALSNLMAAGFDAEELAAAVDLLGGAVVRFPDTLKFESLADGLQETLATGSATGQYAELLERMGVNLDDFNKALEDAKTAEEDQQIALAYLTQNGLATTYLGYKETNKQLLQAEEATIKLTDAMAGFGEIVDTVTAPAKLKLADFLLGLSDWLDNTVIKLDPEWHKDQLRQKNTSFADALEAGELDSFGGAFDFVFKNLFPSAGAEPLPTTELQDYGFEAMQEFANGMMHASESNPDVDAAVKTALAEMRAEDAIKEAQMAGKNMMIEFGNGIAEGSSIPINNVANMVNQINAMLAQIATPAFGLGWSGMTGGNIYLYNQQKTLANTMSKTIGRGVMNTTISKK